METNHFNVLASVNVSDKTDKKGNFDYISWAVCWRDVKALFPKAQYKIYKTPEGCNYWTDGRTAWVEVGVTIEGEEHIEHLPIMKNNKSIPLEGITSFEVNYSKQRALVKACAMHGYGISVYAGEDLNEGDFYEVKPDIVDKINKCKTTDELNVLFKELQPVPSDVIPIFSKRKGELLNANS